MTPHHPTLDREALQDEAADWLVRLNDRDFDPDEPLPDPLARNEAFLRWVCQSKHHYAAFLEIYRVHKALERLGDKRQDVSVLVAKAHDEFANEGQQPPEAARHSRARGAYLFAAAAILLVVAGYFASLHFRSTPGKLLSTKVGEVKQFTLEDGTRVVLDTDSRVQVRFELNSREVDVIQGGAFFSVVHDKTRPFRTCAGNVLLEDVGTEYAVQAYASGAGVTVTSGEVKIAGVCKSSGFYKGISAARTLLANQTATIDLSAPDSMSIEAEALTAPQIDAALSWRRGVLIFEDVPLNEVLRRINRYLSRKLILGE